MRLVSHIGALRVGTPGTPSSLADKQTYNDTSAAAPALAVFRGDVYLGWAGTDSGHHVNVARLSAGHVSVYGLLS